MKNDHRQNGETADGHYRIVLNLDCYSLLLSVDLGEGEDVGSD